MSRFKNIDILAILLLAIFSLTTVRTCLHGHHCADKTAFSDNNEHSEVEKTAISNNCDDCDEHDNDSDMHLCFCLCHTPASLVSFSSGTFSGIINRLNETNFDVLAFGFFNRLERPPKHA